MLKSDVLLGNYELKFSLRFLDKKGGRFSFSGEIDLSNDLSGRVGAFAQHWRFSVAQLTNGGILELFIIFAHEGFKFLGLSNEVLANAFPSSGFGFLPIAAFLLLGSLND